MVRYGLGGSTQKKVSLALIPVKLKKTTNEYYGIHIAFFLKISPKKIEQI